MVELKRYGSWVTMLYWILLPKIKKQFEEGTSHKKDPRIGVSISTKQIKEYGQRIR